MDFGRARVVAERRDNSIQLTVTHGEVGNGFAKGKSGAFISAYFSGTPKQAKELANQLLDIASDIEGKKK